MNLLAHIHLSNGKEDLILGNAIGDFVKGKGYQDFPEEIKTGIILHRLIDTYADTHPLFKKVKSEIFDVQKHYAGVVVDIYFDFFLAKNWQYFSQVEYDKVCEEFHNLVQRRKAHIPSGALYYFEKMKEYAWMEEYGNIEGISRVFDGMHKRVKYDNRMNEAPLQLADNEIAFEALFFDFMKEIQNADLEKEARLFLQAS